MRVASKRGGLVMDLRDYWEQLVELGQDITQDAIAFPKDLHAAHQACTEQLNAVRSERRLKEEEKRAAAAQSGIEKRLPELRRKYAFEACGLILRPAESAKELIDESGALNHCVRQYVGQYSTGGTVICVLRRAEAPDTPWYTVEFSAHGGGMTQCRGYKNQTAQEDKPLLDAFWAAYRTRDGKRRSA